MNKITKAERAEAIERLREMIKPGDTLFTVLRHVSKSGMSRRIDVVKMEGGEPHRLTEMVALAIGARVQERKEGLVVGGCGMDMGFHVVYQLGSVLFPEGFKLAEGQWGRNGDKSGYDKDGGYAINQRWL